MAPTMIPAGPGSAARAKGKELETEIRANPAASALSLTLAVIGSVVGAVLTSAVGSGRPGALIGAAIGPVLPLVFRPAPRGLRTMLIVCLSVAALLVTVTGFTVGDKLFGRSLLGNQGGSLLPTDESTGTPVVVTTTDSDAGGPSGQVTSEAHQGRPQITAPASLDCGTVAVGADTTCESIEVRSTGDANLKVTRLELQSTDFTADGCVGTHHPGDSCTIEVHFAPQGEGSSSATLLIHQNLAGPATSVTLTGTATGGGTEVSPDACANGFVWRDAFDGDHICVTPDVRDQMATDNAAAASRVDAGAGFGPQGCASGFVWRVARASDLVCVTPEVREAVHAENQDPTAHRAVT